MEERLSLLQLDTTKQLNENVKSHSKKPKLNKNKYKTKTLTINVSFLSN